MQEHYNQGGVAPPEVASADPHAPRSRRDRRAGESPAVSRSPRTEAEVLLGLLEAASQADSVAQLHELALDTVTQLLAVDRAAILLLDDDRVMRFVAWRGLSDEYRRAVEGHNPWVGEDEEPQTISVADVRAESSLAQYQALFEREGIGALAFVPLVIRGQLLGKFMVYAPEVRELDARELRMARTAADQIALAVTRVKLLEGERKALARAERNARQTDRLQAVTARLSRALTAPEVAEAIIDEGTIALRARMGGIWLLEGEEDAPRILRLVRAAGLSDPRFDCLPLNRDYPLGAAVVSGQPVLLASGAEYARRFPASEKRTRSLRNAFMSVACVPLVLDDRVLGGVMFVFEKEHSLERDELGFLDLLARHCAQALERARLIAAERAARRAAEGAEARAAFLADASLALSASLEWGSALPTVARLAVPAVCDGITIAAKGRHGEPLLAVAGIESGAANGSTDEVGVHLAVPIVARDRALGSVRMAMDASGRRFGPADRQMAEQLGRRVGAALERARLYRRAIDAVAVRDEFLESAGHELRTPLTPILLEAQMLARGLGTPAPPRDKLKDRADKLIDLVHRMTVVVDQLLNLSHVGTGNLELEWAPVDLVDVVDQVVARFRDEAGRAGSVIQMSTRAGALGRWDRTHIDQVVSNILANAIKYGGGQPIDIDVDAGGEGGMARLSIRDRGIGVPREDQERIFERFERAAPTRNFGGLGMGLWIVRRVVDAHGGSVSVDSRPGRGACFTVELPLDLAAGSPHGAPKTPA